MKAAGCVTFFLLAGSEVTGHSSRNQPGKEASKGFLVTIQQIKIMGNHQKLETEICNLTRIEMQTILKDFFQKDEYKGANWLLRVFNTGSELLPWATERRHHHY